MSRTKVPPSLGLRAFPQHLPPPRPAGRYAVKRRDVTDQFEIWNIKTGECLHVVSACDIKTYYDAEDAEAYGASFETDYPDFHPAPPRERFHSIRTLALSRDGETIVTLGTDDSLKVWNTLTGTLRYHLFKGRDFPENRDYSDYLPRRIAISPDSKKIAVGYSGGLLRVHHCRTGDYIWSDDSVHRSAITNISFLEDGLNILSVSDKTVMTNDSQTGILLSISRSEKPVYSELGTPPSTPSRDAAADAPPPQPGVIPRRPSPPLPGAIFWSPPHQPVTPTEQPFPPTQPSSPSGLLSSQVKTSLSQGFFPAPPSSPLPGKKAAPPLPPRGKTIPAPAPAPKKTESSCCLVC